MSATLTVDWLTRKMSGTRVEQLLRPYPAGTVFRLRGEGAYSALYIKEASELNLWSQVKGTTAPPHVINIRASHLGFCVRYDVIAKATKI